MTVDNEQTKTKELLDNLDKLHTTELGEFRIKRNLDIEVPNVVNWCRNKISCTESTITRKGKNWYAKLDGIIITINSSSYTIITAHKIHNNI